VEDSVIVTPEVVGRIDAIQAATGASHAGGLKNGKIAENRLPCRPERIARLDLNVLDD